MSHGTEEVDTRAVLSRLFEILAGGDLAALDEVMQPDYEQYIPQSGERVAGLADYRSIIENYPERQGRSVLTPQGEFHIAGHGPHYVMTPTFNLVKVAGDGDELTSYVKAVYPDGSEWFIVNFFTFREGKIARSIDFFAPVFEPPAWRSQWVRGDPAGRDNV